MPFLCAALALKRKAVKNLLKFGGVAVNGRTVRQFDHPLAAGDEVTVGTLRAAVAADNLEFAGIQVVFEDEALIVLEKPAGLLTVATDRDKTDTLYFRLNAFLRGRDPQRPERALVVHRLDKETSGLVLFAKSEAVQRLLQGAWPEVEKVYWAVVKGCPNPEQGTITSYLTEAKSLRVFSNDQPTPAGRLSTTRYRRLQTRHGLSLLEIRLDTGRKHQIRVHLASIGCTVAGDRRYGTKRLDPCHRLGLHAGGLALAHPLTGKPLAFESPLPRALARLFPAPGTGR